MAVFPGTHTDFKHGIGAYSNRGCRCDVCKTAAREKRTKEKERLGGTEPPEHGTNRAYCVYFCRCGICVSNRREWQKTHRSKKLGKEPPEHGNTGYWLYGCRCEVCSGARRESDVKRMRDPEFIAREKERSWARQGIEGFTYSDYCRMYEEQGESCAICNRHMVKATTNGSGIKRTKVANVDHDHETGRARSLLCNNCNKMLGCGRNSDTLRKGAAYLDYHNGEIE